MELYWCHCQVVVGLVLCCVSHDRGHAVVEVPVLPRPLLSFLVREHVALGLGAFGSAVTLTRAVCSRSEESLAFVTCTVAPCGPVCSVSGGRCGSREIGGRVGCRLLVVVGGGRVGLLAAFAFAWGWQWAVYGDVYPGALSECLDPEAPVVSVCGELQEFLPGVS